MLTIVSLSCFVLLLLVPYCIIKKIIDYNYQKKKEFEEFKHSLDNKN